MLLLEPVVCPKLGQKANQRKRIDKAETLRRNAQKDTKHV